MKVKEAYERLNNLDQLANNVRLINQYFLQLKEEDLKQIADKHGINAPIKDVMNDATEELYALAKRYKTAIEEADIGTIGSI